MRTTIDVDMRAFTTMVRDLQRISGKDFKQVIRTAAAGVIQSAMKRTAQMSAEKAIPPATNHLGRKFNNFAAGGLAGSVNERVGGVDFRSAKQANPRLSRSAGKNKTWLRVNSRWRIMEGPAKFGNRELPNGARWSDNTWGQYQALKAEKEKALKAAVKLVTKNIRKSRGLTRQSWYQIAVDLRIDHLLRGIQKYVKEAKPTNGRAYRNGFGSEEGQGAGFILTLRNTQPLLRYKDQGSKALAWAIRNQTKKFQYDLDNGVFRHIASRSQRYPGLFVTR